MKIQYYPRDQDGPGCYRCLYPAYQLSQNGHKATLGPYEVVEESEDFVAIHYHLDAASSDQDLVVLAMPLDYGFCVFQKELQERGIKVVIELDDDYLNLPNWNPAKKATAANKPRDTPNILNLLWCLRHADGVTVSTPALRDSVAKVTSAPIYVLRNFLDWRAWHRPPVYEARTWEKLRIGYLGMAQWHSGDLKTLNPWFGKWMEKHPDVEFVASGDPRCHDLLNIPEAQRVSVSSFAFRHQEVADFASTMDVGLVPLQRHKFNEAKSHLKGMEYAGAGVPCLASPTESYRDWWLSGRDEATSSGRGAGFICDGPDEWIRALDCLYADAQLRLRMGQAARQLASENTYQQYWRLWEQAYSEILSTGSPRSYAHASGRRADSLGVLI